MPGDPRKILLFLMTKSNLTSKVLVNANITWISIKVGYWSKEMPENYTRRKEQLDVSPKRLKKKYRALGPVSEEKKSHPAGAPETDVCFWPEARIVDDNR